MTVSQERPTPTETRLARLGQFSHWLDDGLRIPGTRFRIGLDPILGLVPGLGDAAGAILAAAILVEAMRSRIGRATLVRMAANIALDAALGSVPLLGDIFDAAWKANLKNMALLERHLAEPSEARQADRRFVIVLCGSLLVLSLALVVGGALLTIVLFNSLLG